MEQLPVFEFIFVSNGCNSLRECGYDTSKCEKMNQENFIISVEKLSIK